MVLEPPADCLFSPTDVCVSGVVVTCGRLSHTGVLSVSYLSGELPWNKGCLRAYGTCAHCVT